MSNEKREEQKRNREAAIRKAKAANTIKWIVIVAMILAFLGIIGWAVASKIAITTKTVENYSEGLNEDGTIKGVHAKKYVDMCDYKNITVSRSELEVSDEEVQNQIDKILNSYLTQNNDKSLKIKDGDRINLDYVGSIDGVEFQGGSTGGNGTDLTIGSHQYIEGFEESIIGHNVGENFDIHVTFPEDYGKDELNGKEAVFNITVNYVYSKREFNDAFVAEHLSEYATTAEGYIQYYKESGFEKNLKEYITNYIMDNSTVKRYPKKYLQIVKGQLKNSDYQGYQYNLEYYGVSFPFEEYVGMDEKEYEASLSTEGMKTVDDNLKIQAILEDANLTVSEADVYAVLDMYGLDSKYYASYETEYGKPYLYQTGMIYTVISYVQTLVTVTD
ncbi:MAG: FKBP-type peptidyl-prolyl cis-trans isomerase [Lachnospiraceae bacterium]|nr:FKBP-type peptidyl-prolyl cis-trans isomerase [Lachnospiraceae bacterium]